VHCTIFNGTVRNWPLVVLPFAGLSVRQPRRTQLPQRRCAMMQKPCVAVTYREHLAYIMQAFSFLALVVTTDLRISDRALSIRQL